MSSKTSYTDINTPGLLKGMSFSLSHAAMILV